MAPSLGSLEHDVLAIILQYVADQSSGTNKSVVLVNKHVHYAFQLIAHRRKVVEYLPHDKGTSSLFVEKWQADPLIMRNIRELKIIGSGYHERGRSGIKHIHGPLAPEPKNTARWVPLVKLVETASRLEKVEFDYGASEFPPELLRALEKFHPTVNLHIWDYYRDQTLDHTNPDEVALAVSPILRSIKSVLWSCGTVRAVDLRLAACQRIIANAPNLTSASVILRGHRKYYFSEAPAHEEDAAHKFLLKTKNQPNKSLRSLTLDGFDLCKDTMEEWGKFVSLPNLENIKVTRGVSDPSYFEIAPSLLPNLKHVSLNLSSACFQKPDLLVVEDYLASCASLTTLSLWSWDLMVSMETILGHGPTLRSLQLHEREFPQNVSRRVLSVEELRCIREECPHLEDITLDMNREAADWKEDLELHRDVFEEIKKFGRQLNRVQIYLDLGLASKVAMEEYGDPNGIFPWRDQGFSQDIDDIEDEDADNDENDLDNGTANLTPEATTAAPSRPFPPIDRDSMEEHAKAMWKIVFGDPGRLGARQLEIKWGEWERKTVHVVRESWASWESENKAKVLVGPHDRDDRSQQPVSVCFGGKRAVPGSTSGDSGH